MAVGASLLGGAAHAAATPGGATPAAGPDALRDLNVAPRNVPQELIVRFDPGVTGSERAAIRRRLGLRARRGLLLPRAQLVRTRRGSAAAAARALERLPGVLYAEPNFIFHAAASAPDDARFGELWGLQNTGQAVDGTSGTAGVDTNALSAWDTTRGAGAVIAVLDTGVAADHPDLAPNTWQNPGEATGNGLDDDGNGMVDDARGWDFVDDDPDPDDFDRHGTHVAGTAAAQEGDASGIAGVAPDAQVMAVRVLDANGDGTAADLADGAVYAASEGADVLNMSLESQSFSQTVLDGIAIAEAKEAMVVAAAGNRAQNDDLQPTYPCSYRPANVICVAAINQDAGLASFSSFGATSVDVGAPGTNVLSAVPAYGAVYSDDFETPLAGRWETGGTENTWGLGSDRSVSPVSSLQDSPGAGLAMFYKNNTDSFVRNAPGNLIDLTGRQGCRLGYQLDLDEMNGDVLEVAAESPGGTEVVAQLSGDTGDAFFEQVHPITAVDGDADARIRFRQLTNSISIEDGAYIDDLSVSCRTNVYGTAHHEFLDGTSMAAPHVAGVVALVRSVKPRATVDRVAAAIRDSAVATPSLAGTTRSGGRVDARAALDAGNDPPLPSFTVGPNPALVGQVVSLDASASIDPDGSIVRHEWDLDGDGSFETDTGATAAVSRTYTDPVGVELELRVTDDRGDRGVQTQTLTVNGATGAPTASFTVNPDPAQAGQAVSFDGSASSDPEGPIARYQWDLHGDGSFETDTGATATTSRSYASGRRIEVRLRVTDAAGAVAGQTKALMVLGEQTGLADSPWPMFQHDPQHTGRSSGSGPSRPGRKWRFELEGVPGSPVLAPDGTVYVPSSTGTTGYLYALDPDGSLKWRYEVQGLPGTTSPAVAAGGTVYLHVHPPTTAGLATLYAIYPDGTLKWRFRFNDGAGVLRSATPTSPVVAADGTIYVGEHDTALYAITPEGALKWAVAPSANSIKTSPALATDGTVYFVSGVKLFAYNPDGTQRWQSTLPAGANGSPSVAADGTVYVPTTDGQLHALNPDGTPRWAMPLGGGDEGSTPAIAADGTIHVTAGNGLHARMPDGAPKWLFAADGNTASPVVDVDGAPYFRADGPAGQDTTHGVSAAGVVRWAVDAQDGPPFAEPSAILGANRSMYIPVGEHFTPMKNFLDAYGERPVAAFTISPNPAPTGQTVNFDGSGSNDLNGAVVRHEWDLDGNGSFETDTGATAVASRSYSNNATVGVRLRVTDDEGLTDTRTESLTITNRPPVAAFTVSPNPAFVGQLVTFDSSGSSDPDGSIASRAWDLDDDGQFDDGTGVTAQRSFSVTGAHPVRLRVTDDDGAADIRLETVSVPNRAPVAAFTVSPNPALTGQAVTFDSSGSSDPDGPLAGRAWDLDGDFAFDDGTGVTAQRAFADDGVFTVRLRVTDPNGVSDVRSEQVTVENRAPVAAFTVVPAQPLTNETVTFDSQGSSDADGSIVRAWDLDNDGQFDDGSGVTAQRSFPDDGNFTVKLRVTDDDGASHEASSVVAVQNRPPVAAFTTSPNPAFTGEMVTFNSSGSSDPDGSIASRAWDLDNDGAFDDGTGVVAQRAFPMPGAHTVRLRVTDDDGDADVRSEVVSVPNRAPTAAFTVSPNPAMTGQAVTFDSSGSFDPDGPLAGRAWDLDNDGAFDDGTGVTAQRSFPGDGSFTVRLRVTDGDGASDIRSEQVTVENRAPAAAFTASPGQPLTNETVTFNSSGSSDPDGFVASRAWDLDDDGQFDDGSGVTEQRSFPDDGNVTVKLRVTDDDGATAASSVTVAVQNRKPVAAFTIAPDPAITGQAVTFDSSGSADPDGSIAGRAWDLDDDGQFDDGTGVTAERSFPDDGVFTVSLEVTDDDGATHVHSEQVTVENRAPTAAFTIAPNPAMTGQAVAFDSSGSADPDGSIASRAWDLDNDGAFDDGAGTTAQRSFPDPGVFTVRLQVTDDDGAADVRSEQMTVDPPPPGGGDPGGDPGGGPGPGFVPPPGFAPPPGFPPGDPDPDADPDEQGGGRSTVQLAQAGRATARRGVVQLRLSCAGGGGGCEGGVRLQVSGRQARATTGELGRARQAKTVLLGRARFEIRAGRTSRVRIRLTRAGRRLLAKRRRLNAVLVIRAGGPVQRARLRLTAARR